MTKLEQFENILTVFKALHSKKLVGIKPSMTSYLKLLDDLKNLKSSVYNTRIECLTKDLQDHPDLFRLSTFELMEHNFRENSHSNVLQYLFNYANLGDNSIKLLQNILQTTNTEASKFISSKLALRSYQVHREFSTDNGRIDILISDDVNKFNIVIENKLLAGIAAKEFNDKKEVTKTQLDDYFCFINTKYQEYQNIFFLLSYYSYDDEIQNYERVNYSSIYSSLRELRSDDVILNEYKSLLTSLITGIDKHETATIIQKLTSGSEIQLNSIEKLNKLMNYEIENNQF